MADGGAAHMVGADHVDADDLGPAMGIGLEKLTIGVLGPGRDDVELPKGGIVDDAVQRPKTLQGLGNRLLALAVVGDVIGQCHDPISAVSIGDLGHGLVKLVCLGAQQCRPATGLDDGLAHFAAHAAAAPGDDGDPAVKLDITHGFFPGVVLVLGGGSR